MPFFSVIVAMGQPPQAPVSLTVTTPALTFTSSTSPPSACRFGLIFASTFSTFSFMTTSSYTLDPGFHTAWTASHTLEQDVRSVCDLCLIFMLACCLLTVNLAGGQSLFVGRVRPLYNQILN
jgi:hypothetical protein